MELVQRCKRLARQQLRTRALRIHDAAFRVPIIDGMRCRYTERWMVDVLREVMRDGTFLDVGANLGQTLAKVKALRPDMPYVGIEPNPACVYYLRHLIMENNLPDCTVIPVGLHRDDTLMTLYSHTTNPACPAASLIDGFRPEKVTRQRIPVAVSSYPSVAGLIGEQAIGMMKIDVEGAELEVFEALYDMIMTQRPNILFECLPVYSSANIARLECQERIEALLRSLDYTLYRVAKAETGEFEGLLPIESLGIHDDLSQCDYVARPVEAAHA